MAKITKEMQSSIDAYGSRIKTLKDFVESVRQTKGMYVGAIGNAGFLTCIREIFQNAVDQLTNPLSPCDYIFISYNEKTLEVVVEDNGLGLPFADMVRILTSQHTSSNYEKVLFVYTAGLNGVGGKIVNALSSSFSAESYHYSGEARRIDMIEGYPTTDEPYEIPNPTNKQGTKITFTISEEQLGELSLSQNKVYKLIKRIISLTPIGTKAKYVGIDINGKEFVENIENTDGILTDIIMKVKTPMIKPIVFGADNGEKKIDIAFCYDADGGFGLPDPMEHITAFSNFCPTTDGTHIKGFMDGLNTWFCNYMNKIYLSNQKKTQNPIKIVPADIRTGLNVMISAAHLYPNFTGQAKEILSNEDMLPFAKSVVIDGLDEWSKNNPQDLQKLCVFFKNLAEIRQKSDMAKVKIIKNYAESSLSGMPIKYKRPSGNSNLEFIIVEGDSAAGSAADARCKVRQGIFPIRGKIKNAFSCSFKDIMENSEIQAINKIILGGPYRRNFDPIKDVKFDKIIFLADADVDGDHISALLERYFLLYMPQLIEAGKVYKAIPPLFGVKKPGNKTDYFTERIDIIRYTQKIFVKDNVIQYLNGDIVSNKDLTTILLRNVDYIYELESIADRYAFDATALEMVILNHLNNTSASFLQKKLKSEYRFIDTRETKNTIIIEGIINKEYHTLYWNDKIFQDCSKIIKILQSNDVATFLLNGKETSIYGLMQTYMKTNPKEIQRYKGLGEMDAKNLKESVLHPDYNRTLIRYTIEDLKEEIAAVRVYESDKKLLLAKVGVVSRTDLLG